MKRIDFFSRIFFLLVCVAFTKTGFSQLTFKDYFNEQTPFTYLGADFTEVKISGQTDFEIKDLRDRHFSTINNLVLNPKEKKYDMEKFFHKANVERNISFAEAHNAKIDADKIKSTGGADDETHLTPAGVEKIVKGYNFGKKGMGAMVVVESLSKIKEHGTAYLVIIDLSNSKVLYSEKFTVKAGGIGLRNYWAKVVYNVLDNAGDKYNDWKKANGL